MGFNKKFFTSGGIVASSPAVAAFDPLQNFETVTYTGNGGTQKITGYIRKGAAFNGSSSIITATRSFSSNSAYSVSGWVNIDDVSGYTIVALFWQITGTSITGFYLEQNSGVCKLHLEHKGETNQKITYTFPSKPSGWNHFAATFNGTNSGSIYLNGSSVVTDSLDPKSDVSQTFYIGGGYPYNNVTYYRAGKIDQVRYFNTALNSTQVGQLADEEYGDAKNSVTDFFGNGSGVALYELDEDANSSNFEQGAVFNGSSSKLDTGYTFANTTFSVSLWFKTTTTNIIITNTSDTTPASGNDGFRIYGNQVILTQNDVNIVTRTFSSSLADGNWHNVVVTNDGSTLTVYIDGDEESTDSSTSFTQNNSNPVVMGYQPRSPITQYFNGSIDQVRLYSSALDSDDVAELYAESADVPTTNLVAHYKLDGNATDEQGSYDGTETNITYSAGVYGGTPTNVNFLGMAFQPDLVWVKARSTNYDHQLHDSVRGAGNGILSNDTSAEFAYNTITSFDSNGFTVDASSYVGTNANNQTFVAWCWRAAGSAVSNTNGTITSQVSANTDAGFSIVKYTGNGTLGATVGHGLSSAPELFITKSLDGGNWGVYNSTVGAGKSLFLNFNYNAIASSNYYNNTNPTSTVFSIGDVDENNTNNEDYIAYCFHSVDGYQKVGSYTGNASVNLVETGFRPRFVMIKRSDGTGNWVIIDSLRVDTSAERLYANLSNAGDANQGETFSSTGFYTRPSSTADTNVNGATYIYLAIA